MNILEGCCLPQLTLSAKPLRPLVCQTLILPKAAWHVIKKFYCHLLIEKDEFLYRENPKPSGFLLLHIWFPPCCQDWEVGLGKGCAGLVTPLPPTQLPFFGPNNLVSASVSFCFNSSHSGWREVLTWGVALGRGLEVGVCVWGETLDTGSQQPPAPT